MAKWIEDNTRIASTLFRCPYCNKIVYYNHGASHRNKNNKKECRYKYCPHCGKEVK